MTDIKVVINGANGRMGKLAVAAITDDPALSLVATAGRHDDLAEIIKTAQPDVVVDLTLPDTVYNNCKIIIEQGCSPVIGTSGLTEAQLLELTTRCEAAQIGGVIAPNFSLGAIMMMQCAKLASKVFSDVEIIETHHAQKLDAPSGTAMKTAALIGESNEAIKQDIPIHSVRLPGFIADQSVIFGGNSESLTIEHKTLDRSCFMPGLVLACKKVTALNKLYYGLEHILELS